REPGRDRVAEAGAQAAERPGVQPPAGTLRLDVLAGEGDEIAAVPDDDRVVVEYLEQLAVDPGRMHRIGVAGQQRAVERQRGADRLGQSRGPVRVRPVPKTSTIPLRRQVSEERGQVAGG